MARLVRTGKQRRKRNVVNNEAAKARNEEHRKSIRQKWKRTAKFDEHDEERLRLAEQKRADKIARQALGMASVPQG